MIRRTVLLFYLIAIPVGAYLLADTINHLIGARLEASVEPPEVSRIPTLSAARVDTRAIIEGNIFNRNRQGQIPVTAQDLTPTLERPLTPLPLRLIGIVVGNQDQYAVIENSKTRIQELYRPGDRLQIGLEDAEAKIIRMTRAEVILLRQGQQERLTFEGEDEKNPSPGQVSAPPPSRDDAQGGGQGIRQVSEGQWVLDRREVDSAIESLPTLLTKARVIPSFTNGKPDGFKIFAIVPDSLYAKIGLVNGDIIQRINGIEMRDPQNFMRVFQQLKDEPSITIDLVRNNRKETFGYEIR